ncbi:hypothetical protein [Piscinibacter gummiphilus]|uniref:Uncharacterized protein n=1 Tax=Piscinibacter gummiphilus TaxID=946333 RepID=A0ABZ0CU65_9BURK|nr:hypothetical protein [Piscinibacter gummiphilus]WOB06477.1 hypothetical protein RXV79_16265 [Piscinibacter gummiphilus]
MGFSLSNLAKKVVGSSSGGQGILNTLNPLRGGTQGLADLGDPLSKKVNDMVDKNDPLDDAARQNDHNAAQGVGLAPPDAEPFVETPVSEVGVRGSRRHSRGNQISLGAPAVVTPEQAVANQSEFAGAWNDANSDASPTTSGPINLLANNTSGQAAGDEYRDAWFGNSPTTTPNKTEEVDDTSELGRRLGLGA